MVPWRLRGLAKQSILDHMIDGSATDPIATSNQITNSLELLADMGRDFIDSQDIEGTLNRALGKITEYVDAESGALFVLEEQGRILRCQSCVGITEITGLTLQSDHGVIGRSVQSNQGEIVRDASKDSSFDGSVDKKTGYTTRSILCAPLSIKDEKLGAIELINKRGGDGLFNDEDLLLLEALATSAALAILNARMASKLVEQEKVKRELELAAEIQRNLIPSQEDSSALIHGINIPARTVSGDFFDYFTLEDGRIAFCLGDVSGKGINAALLMAKTVSLYRCLGKDETSPGRLLARINLEICETSTRGMFVTLVGGLFDPKTGIVRFANAGHEPPLYCDKNGVFASFEADAPPVGILPDIELGAGFNEVELNLDGGTLYLFTDGVTEGTLANGDMLGTAGVQKILTDYADYDLDSRLSAVVDRIRGVTADLHDDITILGLDASGVEGRAAGNKIHLKPELKLHFSARAKNLRGVRGRVRDCLENKNQSELFIEDIIRAIDEACQNIIRHAYGRECDNEIILEMLFENDDLVIYLSDFADPVDTSSIKPRDLDDVRPGGLGTHFIRQAVDEIDFLEMSNRTGNVIRMSRKLVGE